MHVVRPSRLVSSTSLFFVIALGMLLSSGRAEAYPWMIKNDHPACAQCHMDPSGAGLLTTYGREIGEAELPMRYGAPPSEETLAARSGFAWGLMSTPDWLLLGLAGRYGLVVMKPGRLARSLHSKAVSETQSVVGRQVAQLAGGQCNTGSSWGWRMD